MKTKFGYYYEMLDERQKEFEKNCIYVLDTNVLLDILRLGKELADKALNVLQSKKERIAIPFYVGKEYHKHFVEVVHEQAESHGKAKTTIDNTVVVNSLLEAVCKGVRISPSFRSKLIDKYQSATDFLRSEIEKSSDYYKNLEKDKSTINRLASILDGNVMDVYSSETLKKYEEEGAERYKLRMPPGYMDSKKRDNKYGDYIIWKEILIYAEKKACDICFVSGDLKEDWWEKIGHQKVCPRYELQEEFQRTCKDKFFKIVTLHKFLEDSGDLTAEDLKDIEEIIMPENPPELSPTKITQQIEIEDTLPTMKNQIIQGVKEENQDGEDENSKDAPPIPSNT